MIQTCISVPISGNGNLELEVGKTRSPRLFAKDEENIVCPAAAVQAFSDYAIKEEVKLHHRGHSNSTIWRRVRSDSALIYGAEAKNALCNPGKV